MFVCMIHVPSSTHAIVFQSHVMNCFRLLLLWSSKAVMTPCCLRERLDGSNLFLFHSLQHMCSQLVSLSSTECIVYRKYRLQNVSSAECIVLLAIVLLDTVLLDIVLLRSRANMHALASCRTSLIAQVSLHIIMVADSS